MKPVVPTKDGSAQTDYVKLISKEEEIAAATLNLQSKIGASLKKTVDGAKSKEKIMKNMKGGLLNLVKKKEDDTAKSEAAKKLMNSSIKSNLKEKVLNE